MTLEPHDSKQSQSKTNSQREDRCANPRWEVSAKTQKRSTVFRVLQPKGVRQVRLRWSARKIRRAEMLSYTVSCTYRHNLLFPTCSSAVIVWEDLPLPRPVATLSPSPFRQFETSTEQSCYKV